MMIEDVRGEYRPTYKEFTPQNSDEHDSSLHLYTFPFLNPECPPGQCPFHHPHLLVRALLGQHGKENTKHSTPSSRRLLSRMQDSSDENLKLDLEATIRTRVEWISKLEKQTTPQPPRMSPDTRLKHLKEKTRVGRSLLLKGISAKKKEKENAQKKSAAKPEEKPGFCECCNERFSDMDRVCFYDYKIF
jgi:hypothetical protein